MEPTGFDTVIYSDQKPPQIFTLFENKLGELWPEFEKEEFTADASEKVILYCKNHPIRVHHSEYGFEHDSNGESCILLAGNRINGWKRTLSIQEYVNSDGIAFDSENSEAFFKELWMYTIVTPEDPTKDLFSRKIYEFLRDSFLTTCEIGM